MKCPVEFFDDFPSLRDVSPEDRATLGRDPSAGGMSGEEGEAKSFPVPIVNLFSRPQSDKPRGAGGWPPELITKACPSESSRPITRFFQNTACVPSRCSNTSTRHLTKWSRKRDFSICRSGCLPGWCYRWPLPGLRGGWRRSGPSLHPQHSRRRCGHIICYRQAGASTLLEKKALTIFV